MKSANFLFNYAVLFTCTCILFFSSCENKQVEENPVDSAFREGGEFNKFLDSLSASNPYAFSGSVLIARDRHIGFSKAYRYADDVSKEANRTSTSFYFASVGKSFTALLIMRLAQEGKLNVNQTLGEFFPDLASVQSKKITIHQLLTHTSGIPDYFQDPGYQTVKDEYKTIAENFDFIKNKPLLFEPGKTFCYSNGGYVALGAIIEKVTGQDYFQYLQTTLFDPLKMTRTGYFQKDSKVAYLAKGYAIDDIFKPTKKVDNTDLLPLKGNSAGGGYTSVEDLYNFASNLFESKILNKDMTQLMITSKIDEKQIAQPGPDGKIDYVATPVRTGHRYGYGIEEVNLDGIITLGHTGGFPGARARFLYVPKHHYYLVYLQNVDPDVQSFEKIEQRFRSILTRIGSKN